MIAWWVLCVPGALCLGVVTTIGIAYGMAVSDSELDFGGYGDGDLYMLRETNRWWDAVTVISGDESNLDAVARVRSVKSWEDDSIAEVVRSGNAGGIWPREVIMVGWPSRCLWGARGGIDGGNVESLVDAPEWVTTRRYVHNPLPTSVWWPGMLVDVGVFGGGWLLLFVGVGAFPVVRGWRRGRKGLCVTCGYDLNAVTGHGCPECGAGVRAQGRT